ncbi:MAG: DUF2063 domain-containing protein [Gammaproteobacteria bacterium]|nr:DUF2063 domain-containing protein [Gammaproteobacteria bacterium]
MRRRGSGQFRSKLVAESTTGQNLQAFQALQLDFAAHIRNPELNPIPDGIEARRMTIYVRLIYNNIESFCANRFPKAKAILGDKDWHALVREFVHRHESKSPYFAQISEEFIAYLAMERNAEHDPPFLLELCHFEWLPLYLDRLVGELPPYRPVAHVLEETLTTSDFAQVRSYVWPVHKLDHDFQPNEPPAQATFVLAFRNRADKIDRKVVDGFTANLVEFLREPRVVEHAVCAVLGLATLADLDQARLQKIEARIDDLIELDVLISQRSTEN